MSIVDELLDRWEELREQGKTVSAEELCQEYPELLPEIRRQIKALLAVSLQFGSGGFGDDEEHSAARLPAESLELLNRFEIVRLHASGGLGNVYLAIDKVLDRPVAIKFLKRSDLNQEQLARFEWEAKITSRLEHPGIVPIHSMRESEDSLPCYVMRFVNGTTLQQSVDQILTKGSFPKDYYRSDSLKQLLQSFVTVCNIVAYAHAQGVIHRDVKPNNIMLGPFGETLLLDWGIAKHFAQDESSLAIPAMLRTVKTAAEELVGLVAKDSPAFTSTGQALGTPAYASPEQLMGLETASQPATDIFSLGATLFFILCGKSPIELFGWSTYLEQFKLPESQLVSKLPTSVPKALKAICDKAIRTNTEQRYASASELAADINRYLARESISVQSDPWFTRVARSARKHPAITGAVVAATVVILISSIALSIVLDAKNRRLIENADSLTKSLKETRQANELAVETLRTMFHGVVLHHFLQREELDRVEREYLQQMLVQYNAFANLQGDDRKSRSIQAEANYRAAHLLHWLSQHTDAIPRAQQAVQQYRELCNEADTDELMEEYLESVRLLSEIQTRYENTDEGMLIAKLGIEQIESLSQKSTSTEPKKFSNVRASLRSNIVAGHVQKREWQSAFVIGSQVLAERQELAAENPDDLAVLHGLASELGRLAELAVHPETQCTVRQQFEFADQAVKIRKRLLEAEPDIAASQINYAQAHYARALAHQAFGATKEALDDIDIAINYVEPLRNTYRLDIGYNKAVVEFRVLRLKLLKRENDWKGLINEISSLRSLRLTEFALTTCIDSLSEYRDLYSDNSQATTWQAELHVRRATFVADDNRVQTSKDLQSAVELYNSLVEEAPDDLIQRWSLAEAKIHLAKDHAALGAWELANDLTIEARHELAELRSFEPQKGEALQQTIEQLESSLRDQGLKVP